MGQELSGQVEKACLWHLPETLGRVAQTHFAALHVCHLSTRDRGLDPTHCVSIKQLEEFAMAMRHSTTYVNKPTVVPMPVLCIMCRHSCHVATQNL